MARVSYLETAQTEPKVREMFEKIEATGQQVFNLYRVLAHCPEICRTFIRLGNRVLFRGRLEPGLRELAILAVAHATGATYERVQHETIAAEAGVPAAKIGAVANWRASTLFDERERAVLGYAEEVTLGVHASDQAFGAVRAFLHQAGVVELTVTVAFYNMVSRVLESLEVDLENPET